MLFHASDHRLRAFRPQETCFYREFYAYGYVYAARLPANTEVARYPRGEVRWVLPEEAEIYYVGHVWPDWTTTPATIRRTHGMRRVPPEPPLRWNDLMTLLGGIPCD